MKKILFVVHTLQVGGAERVLINLLKNINKEKYDITVLAIVNDGIYIDEVKSIKGVKYKFVFNTFFKQIRTNKKSKLYKICNIIMDLIWKLYILMIKYIPQILYKIGVKDNYDIEIAFLEGKVSKFVANSKNKKSNKFAWIHTDINNVNQINVFRSLREEIKCYSKFNKIICVSEEVKNRFIQKTGITENLYVQINPISSNEILQKAKEPILEELNYNGFIVCSVGRLVKEKGYDRLLEIHNKLIQNSIGHTLWIVGEGEERNKLELYIKEKHLEHTVNLIGYTDNPYKYVNKANIFVCSSRVEGLSSAVLEAAILKKVIVSTKCPGIKEILGNDGQAGMIVENNTNDLYEGLKTILTNPMLRDKYARNIKKRSELFDINKVINDIERILDE